MPTPAPAPLRVAECRGCGQLFAVYATEGAVACPSCSLPVEVAALETATLGVAEPIEVQIEASSPAEPAPALPPEPAAGPVADSDPVGSSDPATENAPTVAEWLMRNDGGAAAEQDETLPAPEPAVKPTLSESLGWKESLPGIDPPVEEPSANEFSQRVPMTETPTTHDAKEAVSASEEAATESADAFRFDFGATPLSEAPAETEAPQVGSLDLTTPSDTEPVQPAELSWDRVEQSTGKRQRGWFLPLATLAGVALVASGVGFYLFESGASQAVGEANRASRVVDDRAGDSGAPATPPDPYAVAGADPSGDESASIVPPPEPSSDLTIVDPATRPATYDEPGLATSDSSPKADPFASLPPALPPADPEPETPRERYASFDAEPLATLPPARSPSLPAAEPVQPVPAQVGLIGVPLTTLDQLEAALPASEAAGKEFAAGDLADSEQVATLGQHYAQLSYLAQTLTLLDPTERSTRSLRTEMEATDIFDKLLRTARGRSQTLQVAGPWINWSGRPYGGVFFAGDPTAVLSAGAVTRYDFSVGDQVVPVLMAEELDTRRLLNTGAKEIAVLGVIVEEPHKWIAGYEGPAERVVWARKTLPLRAAVEP